MEISGISPVMQPRPDEAWCCMACRHCLLCSLPGSHAKISFLQHIQVHDSIPDPQASEIDSHLFQSLSMCFHTIKDWTDTSASRQASLIGPMKSHSRLLAFMEGRVLDNPVMGGAF